jgi:hypothetical protein
MNTRIYEHLHQVAGAFAVTAGKEAMSFADVWRKRDFEAEVLEISGGAVNVPRIRRGTGWRDDSECITGFQTWRANRHFPFCVSD